MRTYLAAGAGLHLPHLNFLEGVIAGMVVVLLFVHGKMKG